MKYSRFELADGERLGRRFPGLEGFGFEVIRRHGNVTLRESEIYQDQQDGTRVLTHRQDAEVLRNVDQGETRYIFRSRIDELNAGLPDEPRMVAVLAGKGLEGSARDLNIVERVRIGPTEGPECRTRFVYGLGFE